MTGLETEAAIGIGILAIALIASCIYLAYLYGKDEGRRSADPPEIWRLDLHAGDRLVVRVPHAVSMEQARRIMERVEQFAPGHKCAVLEEGMELEILPASSSSREISEAVSAEIGKSIGAA